MLLDNSYKVLKIATPHHFMIITHLLISSHPSILSTQYIIIMILLVSKHPNISIWTILPILHTFLKLKSIQLITLFNPLKITFNYSPNLSTIHYLKTTNFIKISLKNNIKIIKTLHQNIHFQSIHHPQQLFNQILNQIWQ